MVARIIARQPEGFRQIRFADFERQQRTDQRDSRNGIRAGHQRRVQRRRDFVMISNPTNTASTNTVSKSINRLPPASGVSLKNNTVCDKDISGLVYTSEKSKVAK